jgi:hypothetical protein
MLIRFSLVTAGIEQMNHRGPGETGGLPEGFSFAQVVRGQALVQFYLLTQYTNLLLCVDEWGPEFQCPTDTQNLRVVDSGGNSNQLGQTDFDALPFPLTVGLIDSAVPQVYWEAIEQYTDVRMCLEIEPSNCSGNRELHESDSLIDRVEDVAYMIGSTAAHEVGHSAGLIPFDLQGDELGHANSRFNGALGELEIMATHADDTDGFGVIRNSDGSRAPLRNSVEWGFLNRSYLNYFD